MLPRGGLRSYFTKTMLPAWILSLVLGEIIYKDLFAVEDTLAWLHAVLSHEQEAKLLYILEMGWLNLPEHDV